MTLMLDGSCLSPTCPETTEVGVAPAMGIRQLEAASSTARSTAVINTRTGIKLKDTT